jgi:DNA invertase Pin-like site-specific DNA recombinase
MKAAIYARVSTANGSQSPEMQLIELRQYCHRRGLEIAGEYVDAGISGSKERRPQLDALLVACRKRRVDAVVVYRYDRFARSLRQLVNALEEFRSLGIEFISLHEGVDTSTPNGRLVFGIFASIAEFERELIRDRVKSGIAAARSKGKRLGRPRVSVDAATIANLRASGLSWRAITRQLGLSAGTVKRAYYNLSKNPSSKDPASR